MAIPVALLLHVPPGVVGSVRVIVAPEHTTVSPLIAPGAGVTVTILTTVHPVPNE